MRCLPPGCLLVLSLALVGCAGSSGTDGLTRQFDIGFTAADAKLHETYPSILTVQPYKPQAADAPKLDGPNVTIRRDEMYDNQVVRIEVEESSENHLLRRTQIVLAAKESDHCEVSISSSRSKKTVLFPSRDEAYETARMDEIASLLKSK